MGGKEYIHRASTFGGTKVEDVAYGWQDISVLCVEYENTDLIECTLLN